jgi:predicted RNase H-like nuclease
MKENHGGIFRKVAFSCMLEPLIKLKHEETQRKLKLDKISKNLIELEKLKENFQRLKLEALQLKCEPENESLASRLMLADKQADEKSKSSYLLDEDNDNIKKTSTGKH